jgi:hypothetical protein
MMIILGDKVLNISEMPFLFGRAFLMDERRFVA